MMPNTLDASMWTKVIGAVMTFALGLVGWIVRGQATKTVALEGRVNDLEQTVAGEKAWRESMLGTLTRIEDSTNLTHRRIDDLVKTKRGR